MTSFQAQVKVMSYLSPHNELNWVKPSKLTIFNEPNEF